MRGDKKRMAGALDLAADAVAGIERLATDNPALVDDQAIIRLHQIGTKLQHIMVRGMLGGGKPELTPAATNKFPRLYGGTRP